MKVFYDWEFLERGPDHPIVPVSIGMVREDGAEYYAVNGSLRPSDERALRDHAWLGPNVFAHLPQTQPAEYTGRGGKPVMLSWVDKSHPDVRVREQIAREYPVGCDVRSPVGVIGTIHARAVRRLNRRGGARPQALQLEEPHE